MPYVVTGSCNGCGKCCSPNVMGNPLMLNPQTGVRWFYDETAGSKEYCCRLKGANI